MRGKKKDIFSLRRTYIRTRIHTHVDTTRNGHVPHHHAGLWNNRIYECCDLEKSRDAASDSQRRHSLWDTRCTYEKIHALVTETLALRRVYLPFSNLADVMGSFCFATKGWRAYARVDRFSRQRVASSGLRSEITSNVSSLVLPVRFVSGIGSNLCVSVSLLVLRSSLITRHATA